MPKLWLLLPLTNAVNRQNVQNFGMGKVENLCKISLDKIAGMWYTGEFGAGGPCAGQPKMKIKKSGIPLLDCTYSHCP